MTPRDRIRLTTLLITTVAGMTAALRGLLRQALALVVALAILARARIVDRLKAIGNGQVPVVAAAAFLHLARRGGWVA